MQFREDCQTTTKQNKASQTKPKSRQNVYTPNKANRGKKVIKEPKSIT